MTVDQKAFRLKTAATICCDPSPVRKVDRNFEAGGKSLHSGKVITVFVRHQNTGYFFRANRQPGKPADHATKRESAIDQQFRPPGLDEQGIAPTATAKGRKTHHFSCSNNSPRIFFDVSD